MDFPYDIFRRDRPEGPPVWIESVNGLEKAKKRIRELKSKKGGEYLLWDATNSNFVQLE